MAAHDRATKGAKRAAGYPLSRYIYEMQGCRVQAQI